MAFWFSIQYSMSKDDTQRQIGLGKQQISIAGFEILHLFQRWYDFVIKPYFEFPFLIFYVLLSLYKSIDKPRFHVCTWGRSLQPNSTGYKIYHSGLPVNSDILLFPLSYFENHHFSPSCKCIFILIYQIAAMSSSAKLPNVQWITAFPTAY